MEQIEVALRESGLSPAQLKLEITETTIIENIDSVATKMLRLKAIGVQLALDDFGTGYSSLSYLHRLPIDSLKIDKSFIQAVMQDSGEIVSAIIGLAHTLRLDVIAEASKRPGNVRGWPGWGANSRRATCSPRRSDPTSSRS